MARNWLFKMNKKIETNLVEVFGVLKRKISGQDFKDMVRKGWKK